jgi:uncharacterized protein (UPF0210 family)
MKIRSITCFIDPGWPLDESLLHRGGDFISAAKSAYSALGYEVQTARLATVPFPHLLARGKDTDLVSLAVALEQTAHSLGLEYVSLGPALPDNLDSYTAIPAAIAATQNVFLTGLLTTPGGGVSLPAVRRCAEVIQQVGPITPDGFANLRFAALANVSPGVPFFPAAYHAPTGISFALAIEAADLAVEAVSTATSLAGARQTLIQTVEEHAARLAGCSSTLASRFGVSFGGLDFTPASFPQEEQSFGAAMQRLGVPAVGLHGSLAAAAFLIDTLDRAVFPRAGFNGLFLSVLEDYTLACCAAQGTLSVKDLLLFSAVCGTGLDTIPLPGDTTVDQLYAVLLDLAALAQRLDKPLAGRLMPIPGKQAGEPTGFDFAFFSNSRIMSLDVQPLTGLFAGQETFYLHRRGSSG